MTPQQTDFFKPVKQGLVLILLTLVFIGFSLGIYGARRIVLLFLVGVGLGAVIAPLFPYLKRTYKIPSGVTALFVLFVFVLLFLGALVGLGDLMISQILPVLSELPSLFQIWTQKLETHLQTFPGLQTLAKEFTINIEELSPQIYHYAVNGVRASGSALVYTIFILAVAIYTALDTNRYKRGLLLILPDSIKERALHLLIESAQVLRSWCSSQLIVMTGVAAMTAVALLVIGMPNWLSFAILAGVLNLIPYVGPFMTAGILAIVTLAIDPSKVLWIVLAFTFIQQIESYLLVPWAMGRIRIPPIYLLAFIFVMGNWFGLLGIFVASPILAVARKLLIITLQYPEAHRGRTSMLEESDPR